MLCKLKLSPTDAACGWPLPERRPSFRVCKATKEIDNALAEMRMSLNDARRPELFYCKSSGLDVDMSKFHHKNWSQASSYDFHLQSGDWLRLLSDVSVVDKHKS